jgi:hypothetical protein
MARGRVVAQIRFKVYESRHDLLTRVRPGPDFSLFKQKELPMFKLPLLTIYLIISLNITAFTLVLQMDWLIFHSVIAKVIAWAFTIGSWVLAYMNRDKFITLF